MSLDEVRKVVDDGSLSIDVADKYLRIYVANIDWTDSITKLWDMFVKKTKSDVTSKNLVKKAISCTILLPILEKTIIPDPPTNLLFWSTKWEQFSKDDWFDKLVEVIKYDVEIAEKRNKLISLGVISRIDVSPMTRQAYNWLFEKYLTKEGSDSEKTADIKNKFSNLVKVYGGAVICNMFMNHKSNVEKVFNWRSGYFFEREIHNVYTIDQIQKIKMAELNKINSNNIKKIDNNIGV